jgi:hypothetical protein
LFLVCNILIHPYIVNLHSRFGFHHLTIKIKVDRQDNKVALQELEHNCNKSLL